MKNFYETHEHNEIEPDWVATNLGTKSTRRGNKTFLLPGRHPFIPCYVTTSLSQLTSLSDSKSTNSNVPLGNL